MRTRLVQETGRRFRTVGWIALTVLVVTGLLILSMHPFLLSSPRLQWKLGLVGLALILSAFHDFVLGPRAGAPGADPSARVRASWVARVNVVVVLGSALSPFLRHTSEKMNDLVISEPRQNRNEGQADEIHFSRIETRHTRSPENAEAGG